MKAALFTLLTLLGPAALNAAVTFVSPLDGSQAIGPQTLQVTTDAQAIDRVEYWVDGVMVGISRRAPFVIAHDFGTSLEPHRITAKVFSDRYRKTESASIMTAALAASDNYNVDLVEVPLRIRASGLVHADDLRIAENGVPQTIRELRPDREPARFVFVVDRSLSMGGGRLDAALAAIDGELPQLRAGDRAEVVLFNHNVSKARAIARGERLTRILGDVTPSGGTSLRDALASIASRERTYAIVITDGGDRNSATSEEQALRAISGTKSVVEAIVLGGRSDFLARAASNTGGSVRSATRETIRDALRAIVADINSRYTAVYQSQGTRAGWRAIEVSARRRGLEIGNTRKGYFSE